MSRLKKFYTLINQLINKEYWTNFLGLGRGLLAIGTLLTLLLNSNNTLFYTGINNEITHLCEISNISIFCLLSDNLDLAKIISISILIIVILGIYPRFTCIPHWWITHSFVSSSTVIDGGDQISSIIALLLIPICLFDKRKWHWSTKFYNHNFYEKTIAFFFYLLISIQVSVIYFHAAVGKFEVSEWVQGTAVYYWFTHPLFGANSLIEPILEPILKSPFLLTCITWSVMILELFLAFCIFFKLKIRIFALILGLIFHFFIIIIHGLVSFYFAMASSLILYLIAQNINYDFRKFRFN